MYVCHCILSSIFGFQQKWRSFELQYVGEEDEPCDIPVSTQSQHEGVPRMWKCCWPRPFFFQCHQGHRAAVPPHCIVLCRVKGVQSRAPPGHQPSDTCVYESQPRCQQHGKNMHHTAVSHMPAKQCYLSALRQPWTENILTKDCNSDLGGRFFPLIAHFRPGQIQVRTAHSSLAQGGRVSDWSYESCNMILFDWMHQVQIGFPPMPPPLPA